MNIRLTTKLLLIAVAIIAMVVGFYLVHALAGLGARPVVFAKPPAFVAQYAEKFDRSDLSSALMGSKEGATQDGKPEKLTENFFSEEILVRNVILEENSPEQLLRLFSHPEKAQRVKIAAALSAVNAKYTHDEESGFDEKRRQFWVYAKENIPDIQNALFEALITSAEEGTTNKIPYTLAWMPGQDHRTVELLAWAAQHHPDPWVRRFAVFFVVEFGEDEGLTTALLQSGVQDPAYRVRKEVLVQKLRRLTEVF